MSSTTIRQCPRCRTPIPDAAPAGECPRCLVDIALTPEATMTWQGGRWRLPEISDLQSQFVDLEIVRLLGRGGMGAVYLARQTKLDRIVALKIMAPQWALDPVFEERFLREARALARLAHPHIVSVYDMGHAGDYCYIMMEYVDGASLRDLIREGQLSADEAMRLVPQICDAMQYAHDQGVVHRDIKPENVLVDENGQVKIADFGIAKLVGDSNREDFTLTAAGARLGTSGYMAPEQSADTSAVDHRADIYSLGILFYEMLTGKLPGVNYTPPSQVSEVDSRLDRVVARSLRDRPEERFQQAAELKRALEEISASRGALTKLWRAIGLLAAGLVIVGTWAIWGQFDRRDNLSGQDDAASATPSSTTAASSAPIEPPAERKPRPVLGTSPFSATEAAKLQASWAEHLGLPVEFQDSAGVTLRLVPPGEFAFTRDYIVVLSRPFYLGKTEVTVGQFRQFVQETKYVTAAEATGQGGFVHAAPGSQELRQDPSHIWSNARFSDDDRLPVGMVGFADMERFCQWRSEAEHAIYRLPTEAEWSWGARAGADATELNTEPRTSVHEIAWLIDNSEQRARLVASKRPNAWGFHDMFGNMCEMCLDGFEDAFPRGRFENPLRPANAARRPGMGSSFADSYDVPRLNLNQDMPFYSIGFRVMREIPSTP